MVDDAKPPFVWNLPERDAAEASKLKFPFQHLLDLSFLRSFLHLLSANQIDALGGQDQVPLDRLGCNGKKKKQKWKRWACQKEEVHKGQSYDYSTRSGTFLK